MNIEDYGISEGVKEISISDAVLVNIEMFIVGIFSMLIALFFQNESKRK
jgi:hypothetical protein